MPKFIVTLVSYQDVIVEADNEEHAHDTLFSLKDSDWGLPEDGDLYIEPYEGDRPAVNGEEQ